MKIDLEIEFDDDNNLIWRGGAADAAGTSYRLIITRLQLFVPKLIFNSEGQKLYMEKYLKPAQDPSRVMKYVNANNDLQGGTLLNISNFKTL